MQKTERSKLIKQASIKLLLQYGYDKTSIANIAKQIGISKGAIYLEFESKKALLDAIIMDQMLSYRDKWLDLIEQDPEAGTMTSLYKNMLLAMDAHEFIFQIMANPSHILGSYYAMTDSFLMQRLNSTTKLSFIEKMQAANCITKDLSPDMIAELMGVMTLGLMNSSKIKSSFTFKQKVEAMAVILDKSLTPQNGADKQAGKFIIKAAFQEDI